MKTFFSRTSCFPFFLLLLIGAVYLNSLPNEFIFDDERLTVQNRLVTEGSLFEILASYRPVRTLSYAIDYHVWGGSPVGFRAMNTVFHYGVALLLLWFLGLLGISRPAVLVAVLLFALHPLHTDTVSYISGRRDLLMALFYLGSLATFVRYRQTGRPAWFLISLAAAMFSILSKEMGVTVPLLWLLYLRLWEPQFCHRYRNGLLLATFSLVAAAGIYAVSRGGSGLVSPDDVLFHGNAPGTHYMTAATIFIYYLKQVLFPLQLILDNASYPLCSEVNVRFFFSLAGIGSFFLITIFLARKRYRLPFFFMMFYVITLLPVLQIVPLHEIVAEHYLYLPTVGFAVLAGLFTDRYITIRKETSGASIFVIVNRGAIAGLIVLLLFFSVRTITRNAELRDHVTVFSADVRWRPLSFRAISTLGAEYLRKGYPDVAWIFYRKALTLGAWDENLLGNVIGYFAVKGQHKQVFSFFDAWRKKGEWVSPEGLSIIGVLYAIQGECDRKDYIKKILPDLPELRQAVGAMDKCDAFASDRFDEGREAVVRRKDRILATGLRIEAIAFLHELINEHVSGASYEEYTGWLDEAIAISIRYDVPRTLEFLNKKRALFEQRGDVAQKEAVERAMRDVSQKIEGDLKGLDHLMGMVFAE